ncbi:hypothetical protein [Fimbriiglobus ruber]|uniref:Lipoprotein n=1 Tax=Fimbriiglobus ruber TaxID=1908690 RepID=A0A225DQL5_9BACT|nr:hypothetical protein [Fimbriiglobus ruber]OWK40888.1 hypothetical protein FRUB_04780 [Fimbriiglobus ruber]
MRTVRATAVFLVAAGWLAGCGGPGTGDVSGTVAYDGKPVDLGSITFIPADGNGPTTGGTITGGKYAVANVPTGAAKVRINGAKVTGKKKMYDGPDSPVVTTSTEMLPAKYHDATELKFDVKAGSQTKDFDLAK